MRVKKQKQVRRAVRFYKACFGFREPYRVLCDGNFLHYVVQERLGGLREILPALLGGTTKPFVTRCVIAELKRLGDDFSGTVMAARRLDIAKCNHDRAKSAAECLEDMVGTQNPEHFFVATQDVELRKQFRKVPGGALIFAKMKHLVIEPPSEKQLLLARRNESNLSHMNAREVTVVEARQSKQESLQVSGESNDQEANAAGQAKDSTFEKRPPQMTLGVQDKPRFKRKKAKGPNPLSCKSRKKEAKQPGPTTVVQTHGGLQKRYRKRAKYGSEAKQSVVPEKMNTNLGSTSTDA